MNAELLSRAVAFQMLMVKVGELDKRAEHHLAAYKRTNNRVCAFWYWASMDQAMEVQNRGMQILAPFESEPYRRERN
jgi:hypothetical protein